MCDDGILLPNGTANLKGMSLCLMGQLPVLLVLALIFIHLNMSGPNKHIQPEKKLTRSFGKPIKLLFSHFSAFWCEKH